MLTNALPAGDRERRVSQYRAERSNGRRRAGKKSSHVLYLILPAGRDGTTARYLWRPGRCCDRQVAGEMRNEIQCHSFWRAAGVVRQVTTKKTTPKWPRNHICRSQTTNESP